MKLTAKRTEKEKKKGNATGCVTIRLNWQKRRLARTVIEKNFHILLTVEMLLFGSNHLLRGGLANGLGEALAGDAVPCSQQPVVDRLSRHTVPLSRSKYQQQSAIAHEFGDLSGADKWSHTPLSFTGMNERRGRCRGRGRREESRGSRGSRNGAKLAVLRRDADGRTTSFRHCNQLHRDAFAR